VHDLEITQLIVATDFSSYYEQKKYIVRVTLVTKRLPLAIATATSPETVNKPK
jgi:hypothetical protein